MRRSLFALIALVVVAALALFAWRWLAPSTPARIAAPPRPAEPKAEALAPPVTAPPVHAERGEEPLPAPVVDRAAAIAAARKGSRSIVRLPIELSVVDRATHEPLKEVDVCFLPYHAVGDAPPIDDAPDRLSLVHGDSPLTIPAAQSETAIMSFLVRAPGHASAAASFDFRAGGQREVRLEAACELDLMVDAPPGEEKLWIELRRLDLVLKSLKRKVDLSEEYAARVGRKGSARLAGMRAAADVMERMRAGLEKESELYGRFASLTPATFARAVERAQWSRFERLAPGDWIATVVAEKQRDKPLCAVALHVDAGAAERRTLVPKERPPVPMASVHGTIELAPEWSRDEATHEPTRLVLDRALRMVGLPLETSHRIVDQFAAAGASRFTWSAEQVATGPWQARLPQYALVQEFQVAEGDANNVTITVGPPCEVELRLVDARTQKSANVGQITWWSGDGDAGSDAQQVARDGADQRFHFHAPLGRLHVHLDLFDENYFVTERGFDLAPGRNELLFELQQIGRARPCLTDGAAAVPWSDEFHLDVKPVNGPGGIAGWLEDGTGVQLILSPAGRYVIRVDDIPGFDPVGPIEFEVAGGATVDVPMKLTRSK